MILRKDRLPELFDQGVYDDKGFLKVEKMKEVDEELYDTIFEQR